MFWLLASEKRKKVSGIGGWRCGMAIDFDGLPKYWQLGWSKTQPPNFESQATYLQRHGFLSDIEKVYFEKHPGLLDPEKVIFEEDEEYNFAALNPQKYKKDNKYNSIPNKEIDDNFIDNI